MQVRITITGSAIITVTVWTEAVVGITNLAVIQVNASQQILTVTASRIT